MERALVEELLSLGLSRAEAAVYVAVLTLGSPTVSQASTAAGITRTNGYEIVERLMHRGLLSAATEPARDGAKRGRPGAVVRANGPEVLRARWEMEGRIIDDLIPRLSAIAHSQSLTPRVRLLEGAAGIRTALFETLAWVGPLRGIFSMQDLFDVPGAAQMEHYVAGRRERGLWLNVVRSRERDFEQVWPSDDDDLRRTRYAPEGMVFTMTTIIGPNSVCVISSRNENFAMVIDSAEYAATQSALWDVLWQSAQDDRGAAL
ncbi:TrmB family transcriptional regulator [Microbacterium dauci]|uniref:Helix-turn-helix domain-containing protein n=1 Tax=Microbacterium dauci TaxID=3048008 RepID=A0ABT6ZFH3_9MICO|nr:helix-turn-helix domain-containing protein [Microbacterium sp. LX3-4]MDJ1114912.1 helix-turn-helix domain-containing protein [Microbacterium sp. LX3-4]